MVLHYRNDSEQRITYSSIINSPAVEQVNLFKMKIGRYSIIRILFLERFRLFTP